MIRVLGQDDLYRYLAVDGGLLGAVYDTEAAFADTLDQLVASNFLTAQIFHSTDPDEITYTLEVNVAR